MMGRSDGDGVTRQSMRQCGRVVIVVQQQTLREKPRIHKLCRILAQQGLKFELWKFGSSGDDVGAGAVVRNLVPAWIGSFHPLIRYGLWCALVASRALFCPRNWRFICVGFESALTLALTRTHPFVFDNIDNISLSYRWPRRVQAILAKLEQWVVQRATLHVIPSAVRWPQGGDNLRVVRNTPSRELLQEAEQIAAERHYDRSGSFAVYVNGWLAPTRGIRTLICALSLLEARGVTFKVYVAGRLACPDAEELIRCKHVEYLGMLSNPEALANHARSHLNFTFYDPSIVINRLAESQKWTDSWAMRTPFVVNSEVETVDEFRRADACFSVAYADSAGLANLVEELIASPQMLASMQEKLRGMSFTFWDDAMSKVVTEFTRRDSVN